MKKFLSFLLLFILFPALSLADLPVIRLTSPRLNFFVCKEGSLSLEKDGETLFSSTVTLRYRGSTSALYSFKHGYSVHLKENGEPLSASLLNLRNDDDYILDGMYSDPMRMRNRIAMDIWSNISTLPWSDTASGAIGGTFVELYFNDIYKGIYCLNERLDRKLLQISKTGGRIYKTCNPQSDGVSFWDFDGQLTAPADSRWYNLELSFSGLKGDSWQPLTEFYTFVSQSDDEAFSAGIDYYLDLSNCADYYLFINAVGATDNMNKNIVLCVNDADQDSRLYLIPWDLDASFGRLYDSSESDPAYISTNRLFERLLSLPRFQALLRKRWQELRQGIITPDSLYSRFYDYYAVLKKEGALLREAERFPAFTSPVTGASYTLDFEGELAFIQSYIQSRLNYLDSIVR